MRSRVLVSKGGRSNVWGRRIRRVHHRNQPGFHNLFQNRTLIYRAFALATCTSPLLSFSLQTIPLVSNIFQQRPSLPMSVRKTATGSFQTVAYFSTTATNGNGDEGSRNNASNNNIELQNVLSKNPPEDYKILTDVFNWVQRVVIGLNLCPFAEKPFRTTSKGTMKFEVVRGRDEEEIIRQVLAECFVRTTKPGTSLLICPDLYPSDFESFLEVQTILSDGVLVDYDLTDDIQIAPFHPLFEFADEDGNKDTYGSEGFDNYTNRSPYPIFHILREEEVSKAVDLLDGDSSKVWSRNVDLLEELGETLGKTEFKMLLSGGLDIDLEGQDDQNMKTKLQEILKKFRTTRPGS